MQYDRNQLRQILNKEQWRLYKSTGQLPIDLDEPVNELVPSSPPDFITVLCVKFGMKYGSDYVEKLRNMIARHLTIPYEFCCLTDDKHPIDGVRTILREHQGYAKGWWHKVHMFEPGLEVKGRVLYLDLDVIIHDNINKLVMNQESKFMGIRDFNRKFNPNWNVLNSSVMSWPAGLHTDIFTTFKSDPKRAMRLHGDQDWIWQVAKSRITFWPDRWLMSYKWEIRDRSELLFAGNSRTFKTVRNVAVPRECSICVFHGDPNPHQIQDPYVLDNWR